MIQPSISKEKSQEFPTAHSIEAGTKSRILSIPLNLGPILSNVENLSITDYIRQLKEWNFNILSVKSDLEKHHFVFSMFKSTYFLDKLEVDVKIFSNFLEILQEKYNHRKNPFHNFDHGITGFCSC